MSDIDVGVLDLIAGDDVTGSDRCVTGIVVSGVAAGIGVTRDIVGDDGGLVDVGGGLLVVGSVNLVIGI